MAEESKKKNAATAGEDSWIVIGNGDDDGVIWIETVKDVAEKIESYINDANTIPLDVDEDYPCAGVESLSQFWRDFDQIFNNTWVDAEEYDNELPGRSGTNIQISAREKNLEELLAEMRDLEKDLAAYWKKKKFDKLDR